MTPYLFQASTQISATPEALFLFYENPENMRRIAPPSLKIHLVECAPEAVEGEEFRIQASQFGMPINWTGRWAKVEKPGVLVDVGVHSPFSIWSHSHVFEVLGGGSLMTDRVEYLLKGGVAGKMVSRWIMPEVFRRMFQGRHKATRHYFEGHQ